MQKGRRSLESIPGTTKHQVGPGYVCVYIWEFGRDALLLGVLGLFGACGVGGGGACLCMSA